MIEYLTGEVRRCDRRDMHEPHLISRTRENFGAYFNVYCPGYDGTYSDYFGNDWNLK